MRKIAFLTTFTLSGILLSQLVVPAFAADKVGGPKLIKTVNHIVTQAANHQTMQASKAADKQQNNLQSIISKSDTLITNRITSLTALSTRVANDKRLSASEKSSLATNIQTNISGLTSLKTKIDADTDATTARADEKQIITKYYVYAAFEPKTRYLVVLNNLQMTTAHVQALIPQLQKLIDTLKAQGKDVAQLQSLLNDITTQVQTINTVITNDITKIQNIPTTSKPSDGTFSGIKQDITEVINAGFVKIRTDFENMRPAFKQLVKPSATPAPSDTPTQASTSVTPPQTSPSPSGAEPSTSVTPSPSTNP